MINPLRKIDVNRFVLRHPMVDSAASGTRIAQITDPHVGRWVKPRHMLQIMDYVNRQEPDVVALTGDYVGYSKLDLEPCIQTFEKLEAPTFAVLGNHDHWTSTEMAHQAFESSGIPLLNNAHVDLAVRSNGHIVVVGVDDEVTDHADPERAFKGVDTDRFALTLNHVPSIAWECADQGAHLILSGHTHGFQFNIPRLTHGIAERFGTELFAGPYRLDNAMLYISRGLGSASWPVRIRARPELSFFELESGDEPELEFLSTEIWSVEHRKK